jgi:hypothetical protein
VFSTAYNQSKQIGTGLCLAILVDEAGDVARRNSLLKELAANNKQKMSWLTEPLQYLLDTLLDPGGDRKAFDLKELDRRLEACPENLRSFPAFFVAGFLRNHGQIDTARKLYGSCASSKILWEWYRQIALDALKSMRR